jgi:hypothetical protein
MNVALVGALTTAVVGTAAMFAATKRAARRNLGGRCARCGRPLVSEQLQYHVEGVVVCSTCALRVRRLVYFGIGLIAALTVAGGAALGLGVAADLHRGVHYSTADWLRLLGVGAGILIGPPWLLPSVFAYMKAQNAETRTRSLGGS